MKKQDIIDAIITRIENSKTVNYSNWRIGLTHNPDERKQEHIEEERDTRYWKQWMAESLSDAEDIESYFINEKNMQGGTGGNLNSQKNVYVYIF